MNVTRADHEQRIKAEYEASRGDASGLFRAILDVAAETGLDAALAILERLVTEKRTAWLARQGDELPRTADPLLDGYRVFYETYLGLSIPKDGEIVKKTATRLVTRWWNPCPTLQACLQLGLDTRQVCRLAYEAPVQAILTRLDPRLRFRRNYACLRPYTDYCEEIIELVE
jgi:hypothetical protein